MTFNKILNEHPLKWSLHTRIKEEYIISLIDFPTEAKILDLGCGTGYFMQILQKKKANIFGLDNNFSTIICAKECAPGFYIQSKATAITFKDNSFDCVICSDVIEHIDDDELLIKEIYRVSKDGGKVIISTPALEGILTGKKLNLLFHDKPGTSDYHIRKGYSAEFLVTLLKKYKIFVNEVKYTTGIISEIFIEFFKLIYLLIGRNISAQSEAISITQNRLFFIYKKVFPYIFKICKFEEKFLNRYMKGHTLIISGIIKKTL